ncbi:hypothetical protein RUND412_005508 [Rhizina undulata]
MGSSILFAYPDIGTIAGIQGAVVYAATSALPLLAFPLLVPILTFILTVWVQKRYGIIASLHLSVFALGTMFLYIVAALSALQQVIVALTGLDGLAVVIVEVILRPVSAYPSSQTTSKGRFPHIYFLTDNIQSAVISLLMVICSIAIGTSVAIDTSKIGPAGLTKSSLLGYQLIYIFFVIKYRYGKGGDGKNVCSTDIPSYHAGNPIDDSHLLGYGVAIAYKDNVEDVKPAHFTIFSANDKCVNGLYQDSEVPALPACTNGKCIYAWFWEGQDSTNEMSVPANLLNTVPTAAVYPAPSNQCTGRTTTPNNDFSGDYDKMPSYNSKWVFTNGAQKRYIHWILCRWFFFGSFRDDQSNLTTAPNTLITNTRKSQATSAPSNDCSWPGHCAGAG